MRHVSDEQLLRRFEKLLAEDGCYTYDSIKAALAAGDMQSFRHGRSWAITRVLDFPLKRVLQCSYVVGFLEDLDGLAERLEEFAKSIGAAEIRAAGRKGFVKHFSRFGWKQGKTIFVKELHNG